MSDIKKSLRIGIQVFPLAGKVTGIGTYLSNILKNLHLIDQDNEYFLYGPGGVRLPFSAGGNWHLRELTGLWKTSSTLWMQGGALADCRRDNIDVFWSTTAILPVRRVAPGMCVTVNDLASVFYPETLKWDNRIIFPLFFKRSLARADRIIAISKTTAQDLRSNYAHLEDKIRVVLAAVDSSFTPCTDSEAIKSLTAKLGIAKNYMLIVATIEPRKNLERLLEAYAFLKRDPSFDYQLVVAGANGWNNSRIYAVYRKLGFTSEEVKFLSYVPRADDLARLYAGARLFVLPSLYEGFGLPTLEAMASGVPTVVSDIAVFKEILGNSTVYVNPRSPEHIAAGIRGVLADNELWEKLKIEGLARVKKFSWHKAAQETLQVFHECSSGKEL